MTIDETTLLTQGRIKDTCRETDGRAKCANCGDESHSIEEWKSNSNACPICAMEGLQMVCGRCGGAFVNPDDFVQIPHQCMSIKQYQETGRIAFDAHERKPDTTRGRRRPISPGAHRPSTGISSGGVTSVQPWWQRYRSWLLVGLVILAITELPWSEWITTYSNREKIDSLIAQAEQDIRALRLTTPKGNNAHERYKLVLKKDPENRRAVQGLEKIVEQYVRLAEIESKRGNYNKAVKYLERGSKIIPNSTNTQIARQKLKEANRKWRIIDKAVKPIGKEIESLFRVRVASKNEYLRFIKYEGKRSNAALGSAWNAIRKSAHDAYQAKDYKKTIKIYSKIMKKNSKDWWGHAVLGDCYIETGDINKGLTHIKIAIQKFPANFLFAIVYKAYASTGDYKSAIKWLDKAFRGGWKISVEDKKELLDRSHNNTQLRTLLEMYGATRKRVGKSSIKFSVTH